MDMDPHMREQFVERAQEQFADLNLTADQAIRLLDLLDDEGAPSFDLGKGADHFSFWERQDYELDSARVFLTDEQLTLYHKHQQLDAAAYETRMREEDAAKTNEVLFNEEYTTWIKDHFLLKMLRELIHVPIRFSMEKEKVEYLRAEYKQFVARSTRNALVRHYRYHRHFEPNSLRLTLLREERRALLPDYESFIGQSDDFVKAVGNFLADKYSGFAKQGEEFFERKAEESKKQYAELRLRHIGERQPGGWHTTITFATALTAAQQGLMAMMLTSTEYLPMAGLRD
jgi:hypothetical protein